MIVLTNKVLGGLEIHSADTVRCYLCPYNDDLTNCGSRMAADASKVIKYWKGKYESTVLQQPKIILHDTNPIRIEPVDIRSTLKSIKTMERLEKIAKNATNAINEATEAIHALKEEVNKVESN